MPTKKEEAMKLAGVVRPHVTAYLAAKVFAEVERERVDKIQRQVLKDNVYHGTKLDGTKYRIEDPDYVHMDDVSSEKYYAVLNGIHEAAGFEKAKDGYCPALVAESEQLKAEWAMIDAAKEIFPEVTNDALLASGGIKRRQEYIDLLVRLALNEPRKGD